MSYLLLNAAMIPNEGTFTYRLLSREQAAQWLHEHFSSDFPPESYIGYPQTADHLRAICAAYSRGFTWQGRDVVIPLNRAKCTMHPGDEALVCRLAYRIDNPAAKGQPQAEDWEYGVLRCQALAELQAK